MINRGNKITKNQYLQSCLAQENLTKKFESIMKDYDFLITPSTASVAPKIGENEKMDTSLIWTFFGVPAISLPIFYDEKTKLPFGLQIISSRYNDFFLLNFCEKIIKNLNK
jgi:Asp-tRNA(Asn)/Glu-tRNA(Gln) amidotransferase A subunit family amidase